MIRRIAVVHIALAISMVAPPVGTGGSVAVAKTSVQNGWIVFSSDHEPFPGNEDVAPGNLDLFLVAPNGRGLTQITDSPEDDAFPQWSPDGTSLVFARGGNTGDIYLSGRDGSALTRLTDTPLENDKGPSWSPTGKQIVFSSEHTRLYGYPDVNHDLYVMDANGDNVKLLAGGGGSQMHPAWSPRGNEIAYVHDPAVLRQSWSALWSIRPDGRMAREIVGQQAPTGNIVHPDWSPDGSQIVFQGDGTGDSEAVIAGKELIWVVNADGSDLRLLADGAYPAWSPDGKWIVFAGEDEVGNRELHRIRPNGQDEVRIMNFTLTQESCVDWGPRP